MTCPKCGGNNLYVVDCRDRAKISTGIYRRRECADCGERVSTYEVTKAEYIALKHIGMLRKDIDNAFDRYERRRKAAGE